MRSLDGDDAFILHITKRWKADPLLTVVHVSADVIMDTLRGSPEMYMIVLSHRLTLSIRAPVY